MIGTYPELQPRPEVTLAYNLLLKLQDENKADFLECPKKYVEIAINAVNEITQTVKVDREGFEVTTVEIDPNDLEGDDLDNSI